MKTAHKQILPAAALAFTFAFALSSRRSRRATTTQKPRPMTRSASANSAQTPTALMLKQQNGWTYGALTNHIWSYAGDNDRSDINATFIQPFLSFTTPRFTSYGINTESTYDWKSETWSVPVNLTVTQLLRVSGQPLNIQLGLRRWLDSAPNGPEGWGIRAAVTLLFPK